MTGFVFPAVREMILGGSAALGSVLVGLALGEGLADADADPEGDGEAEGPVVPAGSCFLQPGRVIRAREIINTLNFTVNFVVFMIYENPLSLLNVFICQGCSRVLLSELPVHYQTIQVLSSPPCGRWLGMPARLLGNN